MKDNHFKLKIVLVNQIIFLYLLCQTNNYTMENFNQVYKENKGNVFNYIYFKIRDKEVAEELTNDVFVKANAANYDSQISYIYTWLINISKNEIIDYWRRTHSQKFSIDKKLSISQFSNDDGKEFFTMMGCSNADANIVRQEKQARIAQAFRTLKVGHRKVAIAYFLRERKYNEIVEDLSLPLGTVKGMINRSRKMLQAELG